MELTNTKIVEIFTDGGCRGNPGIGGWGVLLRFGSSEKVLKGNSKHTTNNRMELTAVIKGLEALNKKSKVSVTTDSKYVIDGIDKWIINWKKNNWKTSSKKEVKNVDLWKTLDTLCMKHEVNFFWIKGHSGHAENELVDDLANQAMDEITKD